MCVKDINKFEIYFNLRKKKKKKKKIHNIK